MPDWFEEAMKEIEEQWDRGNSPPRPTARASLNSARRTERRKLMTDAYLPVRVRDLPASFVFEGHSLRPKIRDYVNCGIVRVHAGPHTCDLTIDIRRPYSRPLPHDEEALR